MVEEEQVWALEERLQTRRRDGALGRHSWKRPARQRAEDSVLRDPLLRRTQQAHPARIRRFAVEPMPRNGAASPRDTPQSQRFGGRCGQGGRIAGASGGTEFVAAQRADIYF